MLSARKLAALTGLTLVSILPASSLSARPSVWGDREWGESRWDRGHNVARPGSDSREGKVEVASFAAQGDAARALGHGGVTVEFAADDGQQGDTGAAYEAAVIDQLVKAGYDTTAAPGSEGQVAELRIVRNVIEPAETRHKPVSGEMDVGISNRGSTMGMGISIDLRKPKKALMSTRLETRIRDRATGAVLWEGRADIATRDGDEDWSDQAIAARLAQSLFKKFPGTTDETYRAE
ncbi:MAG: hypothetical protein H6R45_313 [Proteobacteria bacterium]|nr:hypothetical protein [Pseudomonadota bacterium]